MDEMRREESRESTNKVVDLWDCVDWSSDRGRNINGFWSHDIQFEPTEHHLSIEFGHIEFGYVRHVGFRHIEFRYVDNPVGRVHSELPEHAFKLIYH